MARIATFYKNESEAKALVGRTFFRSSGYTVKEIVVTGIKRRYTRGRDEYLLQFDDPSLTGGLYDSRDDAEAEIDERIENDLRWAMGQYDDAKREIDKLEAIKKERAK